MRKGGLGFLTEKKKNNWKAKLPSYEEYKNGRVSDLDIMLESVKQSQMHAPETLLAPKKINHWNDVF